jgi:outer membrane lipoprotein SlyB
MEGRAVLTLTLDSFELSGKKYSVHTGSIDRVSAAHKKRNLTLIGGGAGLGALIGGLAGGGKGALIGAGAGAGAGTAGAAITGKKEVAIAAETLLTFPLKSPVKL